MLRLLLLIVVAILAFVLIWLNVLSWRSRQPTAVAVNSGQLAWAEALDWQAADGPYPGGWGWGKLRFETDYLELTPGAEPTAAYIFPVEHAADFVLVAEAMVVPTGGEGEPARLHLMTRDRGAANNVSGCVLTVASDTMYVQHMINAKEHLLARVPTPIRLTAGSWHRIRLTCAAGTLAISLDGDEIFADAGPFPPGLYAEPYLAAEAGTIRLRHFTVLAGPWEGK